MRIKLILLFLFFSGTDVYGEELDILIEAPPVDDEDGDIVAVPDINGGFYYVNRTDALSKPLASSAYYSFNPTDGIYYELYTKSKPTEAQRLKIADKDTLKNSSFNPKHPTRILVHGWRSKGDLTILFRNAYFEEDDRDINLIAVNWQSGASTFNYIAARQRVNSVGLFVGKLIDFLIKEGNLKLESLELIGHSLGAHVCGIAAKNVQSGKIRKIVGLDPASPLFSVKQPDERLSDTDADVVEIIHSNAGFLGFSFPLGTISFYPNGGRSQRGCGWDLLSICAHSRSYIYYAESIHNPTGFYAWKCESYENLKGGKCHVNNVDDLVQMGADVIHNATGIYYLETNAAPMFALGQSVTSSPK